MVPSVSQHATTHPLSPLPPSSLLHQSLSLHRHLTPQAQSLLSSLTSLSEGDPLDCHARALSAASTAAAMRPAIAEAIAATALVR